MKMLLLLLSLSLQKPDQISYWPPLCAVLTGDTFILRPILPMILATSYVAFMGSSGQGATLLSNSCHLVTIYTRSVCQRIRNSDSPLVSGCRLSKKKYKGNLSYVNELLSWGGVRLLMVPHLPRIWPPDCWYDHQAAVHEFALFPWFSQYNEYNLGSL